MGALHIFDMDGTLLRSTATVEISRHLGELEAAAAVEAAWLRGEIGALEFWELVLPLWSGMSSNHVDSAFEGAPWMAGMVEVFADIATCGEHSVVISASPLFFVRRLLSRGVGQVFGSAIGPQVACRQELLVTARTKVEIATEILASLDLELDRCVAYGDSTSDILLFKWLPNTVAVNSSLFLRSIAAASYEGDDLRECYVLGRRMLSGEGSVAGC